MIPGTFGMMPTTQVRPINYEGAALLFGSASSAIQTVTSVPMGIAEADRTIILAIQVFDGTVSSRTITGVTVGGIAATIVRQAATSTTNAAIVAAVVPTGTSASVVITFSGAVQTGGNSGIYVSSYSSGGVASLAGFSSNSAIASSGSISFGPATTPADGFVLAASTNWNASLGSNDYTGFKTTKTYQHDLGGGGNLLADGLHDPIVASAGSGLTIGHAGSLGGGGANTSGVSATFASV